MSKIDSKSNVKGIKVCRISTVAFYIISQLWNQAEYLRNKGVDVTLVSSSGPELSEVKFTPGLRHESIEIPRAVNLWKDFIAFFKLTYFFTIHRFDIVHSTTPKAGLLTSLAAFFTRVPVRIHTWTGQPWVSLRGPLRHVSRLADKLIGLLNTQCYADSKSQRQFLIDEKIIKSEKITVIGDGSLAGVEVDRFNPLRWSSSEKEKLRENLAISEYSRVFIFIGRITRDKGIVELISAFSKVINSGYNSDLILVGPLDQECGGKSSIDFNLIKQSPRIHYTRYQQCPESYLSISDVFCLPSYREGFGTTVIEAAAMGLPTIGTRINGLIDAVHDGNTGILVPDHDVQALFEAMKKMLDDTDLMKKMGKAASQRCLNLFDAKILNEKLIKEYTRLLKMSKTKGLFRC